MASDHLRLERLCCDLEAIADALPHPVAGAPAVAAQLSALLQSHHRDEELCLFAVLRRKCGAHPRTQMVELMDRLTSDHGDDEIALMEIADDICAHAAPRKARHLSPEALGYAMRGFFQAKRRHMALEDTILFPFARDILSQADRAILRAMMRDNRNRACGEPCNVCRDRLERRLAGITPLAAAR